MEQYYNISAINSQRNTEGIDNDKMSTLHDIVSINNTIINSVNIKQTSIMVSSDRIISSIERKKSNESDKVPVKEHQI